MTQTFKLKNGKIIFEKDKIIISDKARKQKYFILSSNMIWMLLGIINVSKFEQSGDEFFHLFWLVFIVLNFLIFVFMLLRSTKSSILLADVKSIKVKRKFGNTILDVILKNNQLRRVVQIEDVEELKEYIETYFDGRTGK